jgi:hypothetical protein
MPVVGGVFDYDLALTGCGHVLCHSFWHHKSAIIAIKQLGMCLSNQQRHAQYKRCRSNAAMNPIENRVHWSAHLSSLCESSSSTSPATDTFDARQSPAGRLRESC